MSALRPSSSDQESGRPNYVALGVTFGMLFGAGLSTILSAALDNPAFIGIGAGCGMCIGVAVGSALQQRAESGR